MKLRHECERCGLIAELERAGRFRDDDYIELLHDYFDLERELNLMIFSLHGARDARDLAKARLHWLQNPVIDIELQPEIQTEVPF